MWEKIKNWLWENRPSDRTSSTMDTERIKHEPKKVGVSLHDIVHDPTCPHYERLNNETSKSES